VRFCWVCSGFLAVLNLLRGVGETLGLDFAKGEEEVSLGFFVSIMRSLRWPDLGALSARRVSPQVSSQDKENKSQAGKSRLAW